MERCALKTVFFILATLMAGLPSCGAYLGSVHRGQWTPQLPPSLQEWVDPQYRKYYGTGMVEWQQPSWKGEATMRAANALGVQKESDDEFVARMTGCGRYDKETAKWRLWQKESIKIPGFEYHLYSEKLYKYVRGLLDSRQMEAFEKLYPFVAEANTLGKLADSFADSLGENGEQAREKVRQSVWQMWKNLRRKVEADDLFSVYGKGDFIEVLITPPNSPERGRALYSSIRVAPFITAAKTYHELCSASPKELIKHGKLRPHIQEAMVLQWVANSYKRTADLMSYSRFRRVEALRFMQEHDTKMLKNVLQHRLARLPSYWRGEQIDDVVRVCGKYVTAPSLDNVLSSCWRYPDFDCTQLPRDVVRIIESYIYDLFEDKRRFSESYLVSKQQ